MKSYEDLQVWQRAMDLVDCVYRLSATFPPDERFGLTSQVRRAAVSVSSNIAEGHARNSTRDFLRFLSMSMGSIAEVRTQLLIAERQGWLDSDDAQTAHESTNGIGRMLRDLMKSLNARISTSTSP